MRLLLSLAVLGLVGACRVPVRSRTAARPLARTIAVVPGVSTIERTAFDVDKRLYGVGLGLRTAAGGRGWEAGYAFDYAADATSNLGLHTVTGGYGAPVGGGVRLSGAAGVGYGLLHYTGDNDARASGLHAVVEGRAEITLAERAFLGMSAGYVYSAAYGDWEPRDAEAWVRAPQLRVFAGGTL